MPRIKQLTLVALVFVLCAMLISRGRAQQAALPAQPAESKLKATLVSDLVATAEEGRKQAQSLVRTGLASSEDVHVWTMRLIDVRLVAAKDKKSRVEALRVRVAMAQEWEKDSASRRTTGQAREIDVTDARYARVQAQMDLANEEAK